MGMSASQYVRLLKGLLPLGDAWPRGESTDLHKLFQAFSEEFARLDQRAGTDLLRELHPSTTLELLEDWERILALPDACLGTPGSITERRNQILYKLALLGGQSRQFFIDLAANLGFEITISEFRRFRAGQSQAGDPLTNGDWAFAWQVNAPEHTINHFRAGQSVAGDPLASWGNESLECAIRRSAPAHTVVIFAYG